MSGSCWALGGTELIRLGRHSLEGEVSLAATSKGHRGHRRFVKAAPLHAHGFPLGVCPLLLGSAQATQQEGEEQSVSFPCRPALQSRHHPLDPPPHPLALPDILHHCQVGLFHQGHWAQERVPGFAWSPWLLLGIDAAQRAESKSPIGYTQRTEFWEWRWPLASCKFIWDLRV